MPFEDFETVTKDNAPPTAVLTYQPAQRKNVNPDAKPKLTISIPTTVCGVSKCKRFKILVGTGTDAGLLRIKGIPSVAETAKVGVKPMEHEHFLKFNFGFVPAWGTEKIAADRHPVTRVDDDTFDVTVPKSWCEKEE